jgi:hypothetical protein
MNLRCWLVAGALCALVPSSAQAAAGLPPVARTLSAAGTTSVACDAAPAVGRGLASTTYTAPMSGYLTVRLTGAGDWDLLSRDAAGRAEHASQSFGGTEVLQTWIAAGETITAEGCRHAGAAPTAQLRFGLLDIKPTAATAALVRVHAGANGQAKLEAAGLDVTESRSRDWADVIVNGAAQMRQVRALGAKVDLREADLGALDDRTLLADRTRSARASSLPSGRDTYRTYEDIQAELKQLVADHPSLVRPVVLGKTFQGREIAGVEIAENVHGSDGRPTFFLMGEHHAREWPSADIAMEFAELLAKDTTDARVAKVLARERVVVVPVVNVDGYISSRSDPSAADTIYNSPIGSPTGDGTPETGESVAPPGGVGAYRRKNCDNEDGNPSTPCDAAHGVDNNRNYGNLWGGSGASADFTSQAYHGQAPRSEPETQAVFNYVRTHEVTTLISLHTIAALVLRPPGLHTGGKAPDERALKVLGDKMAAATGYTSEFGFQLYDTAGTTEDDSYAATGGYGYTIELGPAGGMFHGPYDTNVVQQWNGDGKQAKGGMHAALLEAAETAYSTRSHARLTGTAPAGDVLRLHKAFDTETSKYCLQGVDPAVSNPATATTECTSPVMDPLTLHDTLDATTRVPASGRFAWHIGQSTRPFVNGGAEIDTAEDVDPPIKTFTGSPNAPTSEVDHTFTLHSDLGAEDKVRVHLSIPTGEDYDLELYRKESDGTLTAAGTSGNAPGSDEEILVEQPVKGATYVARVVYYAAATGGYTLTVTRIKVTAKFTSGSKEAYTLTCESPAGKLLETLGVVIDRGQRVNLHLGCGQGASTDADGSALGHALGCALPDRAPTVGCRDVPTGTGLKVKLLRRARRTAGSLTARCRLNTAGTCAVVAKLGRRSIGRGKVRLKRAGTRVVQVRLTRAGRAAHGRVRLVARAHRGKRVSRRSTVRYRL